MAVCLYSCAVNKTNIAEYSYAYEDRPRTNGTYSSETLNVETTSGEIVSVPDFSFGCSRATSSPTGLLDSTDGLVGLGAGAVSFPTQLSSVFENKFAYCLVNRSLSATQSSLLVFGRDAVPNLTLQYTPIISNPDFPWFYYTSVENITVGGVALNISQNGYMNTIIDSGTTFSSLNPLMFDPLLAAIEAMLSSYEKVTYHDFELCYNVTGRPNYVEDLPEISLKMANNTVWTLDTDNSWIFGADYPAEGQSVICLAMTRNEPGSASVLGNTQQADFHVLYDQVENRLGFAKTDCSSQSS
jgi:hypothetical protein